MQHTISQRWALACLSLSTLLTSLGISSANVALPILAQTFAATFQHVQWVVLAYLLVITAVIVSAGRLGDLIGRRRLLLGGIMLFTLASVLCGCAPWLWLLIAARAVQGLGAAIMLTLTMALVGDVVPKERTGSAMGLLGTMSAIGTALGPSLGGMLIAGFSWRAIFLINLPLGILALLLARRFLPADRQRLNTDKHLGFDHLGTLLLALALATYALACSGNLMLLAFAVVAAGLLVVVEKRSASPLIHLTLFANRTLSAGLIMSVLVSSVIMATLVVGPFYLTAAFGLNAVQCGLVLSIGPTAAALSGIFAGRFADRFGAQRMTMAGLSGMAVGTVMVSLIPATLGPAGYISGIVTITVSYALFMTANTTAVMTDVPPQQRSIIAGMLILSRNLGLITGTAVLGAVFAFASAHFHSAAQGMQITFVVATFMLLVSLSIAKKNLLKPARGMHMQGAGSRRMAHAMLGFRQRRRCVPPAGLSREAEAHDGREGGPAADFAGHPQITIHQRQQRTRDRQSQPGPAMPPCICTIKLAELLT